MNRNIFFIIFIFVISLTLLDSVSAQDVINAETRGSQTNQRKEDFPKSIKESLAKQRIDKEKKEFEELLKRGEEAVRLSEELDKSFAQNKQLSSEDRKKLERLEKLVKKIRSEIGASGDDDENQGNDQPQTVDNALKVLQNKSLNLVTELKKTTRYTVSVEAVEDSNFLLKILRFLRFKGF